MDPDNKRAWLCQQGNWRLLTGDIIRLNLARQVIDFPFAQLFAELDVVDEWPASLRSPAAEESVGVDLQCGHPEARVRTAIAVQADQTSAAIHHDNLLALHDNLNYGVGLSAVRVEGGIPGAVFQNPDETVADRQNP